MTYEQVTYSIKLIVYEQVVVELQNSIWIIGVIHRLTRLKLILFLVNYDSYLLRMSQIGIPGIQYILYTI